MTSGRQRASWTESSSRATNRPTIPRRDDRTATTCGSPRHASSVPASQRTKSPTSTPGSSSLQAAAWSRINLRTPVPLPPTPCTRPAIRVRRPRDPPEGASRVAPRPTVTWRSVHTTRWCAAPRFEVGLRDETELLARPAGVQRPARLAIRLGGIPADLAVVSRQAGDQLDQVADGDLVPDAEVHRLGAVVSLGSQDDPFRRVSHVQELARRGAGAPHLDVVQAGLAGIDALLDERRNDMRRGRVEVVAGARRGSPGSGGSRRSRTAGGRPGPGPGASSWRGRRARSSPRGSRSRGPPRNGTGVNFGYEQTVPIWTNFPTPARRARSISSMPMIAFS